MKKGWQTRKLGDVVEVQNGYAFDSKEFNSSKGMPLIRIRSLKAGTETETRFSGDYDKKYVVKAGDLLIGMDGEFGCYEWKGSPALLNQRVCRLQGFDSQLVPRFLFYGVNSHLKEIEDVTGFTTVKHLSSKQILGIEFSLPPFPEQQRIVGILDEAFDGIATAKANAETNLHNARAIFESYLQSVFTKRGKGWVEKTFEDVCHKITDGTHHSPRTQFSERGPGRFPYITSKNIRNNYMDLSNVAYIERAFHDEVYARCQPSLGDVLLTKDGANTGTVTLNTLDEPFSLLSSVCLIKTNQAVLRPVFLCYYLQSSTGLSSIVGQMTGAAIKRIVLKDIKKAAIPFPPLKEQDSIVTTLNSLLAETQRLASLYEQKLAALEALKKSLLHHAFIGEL